MSLRLAHAYTTANVIGQSSTGPTPEDLFRELRQTLNALGLYVNNIDISLPNTNPGYQEGIIAIRVASQNNIYGSYTAYDEDSNSQAERIKALNREVAHQSYTIIEKNAIIGKLTAEVGRLTDIIAARENEKRKNSRILVRKGKHEQTKA